MKRLLLCLPLLVIGCSSEEEPEPTSCSSYEFRVRPDVDPRLRDAFVWSLDVWSRGLSGALPHAVTAGATTGPYEACVIDVRQSNEEVERPLAAAPSARFPDGSLRSGIVEFYYVPLSEEPSWMDKPETLRALALHELGHIIIGPGHDEDRTHMSVMWPVPTIPARLGCEDVRDACELWGCPVECEGQAWLEP